jgi:hypothetical protein
MGSYAGHGLLPFSLMAASIVSAASLLQPRHDVGIGAGGQDEQ